MRTFAEGQRLTRQQVRALARQRQGYWVRHCTACDRPYYGDGFLRAVPRQRPHAASRPGAYCPRDAPRPRPGGAALPRLPSADREPAEHPAVLLAALPGRRLESARRQWVMAADQHP
jgi:hypothetical protein